MSNRVRCSACGKKKQEMYMSQIEGRLDIVCGYTFCVNHDHWTVVRVPVCSDCRLALMKAIQ